jgi:WD40 repeat protein
VIWTAGGVSSRVLRGHTQPVVAVSFSPDGALVLTRSRDGSARVWSAATGGTCAILDAAPSKIVAARFPATGNGILTIRADGVARLESEGVCGLARGDGLVETARRFLRGLSAKERSRLEETE